MTRTDIINRIIRQSGYKSYLEIGIRNPDDNYNQIRIAHKIGVDPNAKATYLLTSDEYFSQNKEMFDIIFIDGLHHAEQVYKDVINSLKFLNANGTIVLHDCIPKDEEMQIIPQEQEEWTGDVWKAFVRLRAERDDLSMHVIDADYGVGIIRRGKQETINITKKLTFKDFEENKKYWLNIL